MGGGLELCVKFAHHEDRERVIHAARGLGWSPTDLDIEQDDWESEGESYFWPLLCCLVVVQVQHFKPVSN